MFNAAQFTLRNNRTMLVLYAIAMLLGVWTFLTIGRLEYPEFTIRSAQVLTYYPGRTTIQVEEEVTEPLEQSIRQMAEVKEIRSTSKPGLSILIVELEEKYFELETIWQDMRNRIAQAELPDGTLTPMVNDDFGDVFPYLFALRGDGYSEAELSHVAENIRDTLLEIDGVARVNLHGEQDERIYLEFSSTELAAQRVSPSDIARQISDQNAVASSGRFQFGVEQLNLVTLGEFETLDELAAYRLTLGDSTSTLRVDDLLNIRRGYVDPPQKITHFNGERVICIAVSMIKGGVITSIGEQVREKIATLQSELPIGLDIESMFYQPEYVSRSIDDFLVNLGQAFFFVVLVMFVFAGWRIALIVGVLVPSAILLCFGMMPIFGVLLELMSIAALIIALGLLVDNAVVVSEQVLVRLQRGESREQAVVESVGGLTIPLLAASGTTIAAFSTIALSPGATSEFTYSLFAVVSLTLLGSWLLSLTIIPLLCFYFLKPLERETLVGRGLERLYSPYEKLLRALIRLRWAYPVVILMLTLVSMWGMRFVPNIFFPPNERGQFIVSAELPFGTDITETESMVYQLEDWLQTKHGNDVRSVSSWIGDGGPRWYLSLDSEAPNPSYAFLSVLTYPELPDEVGAIVDNFNRFAFEAFPDARINAKALENGPPVGAPIQIRLYGSDMSTLYDLRDRLFDQLETVAGLHDLRDDWGAWVKQATIDPDPIRAPRLGLTTSTIAEALNAQFSGITATHYREGDRSIPVVFRSREDFRSRPERLPDLPIFGGRVGIVPLGQVAKVGVDFLPGSVLRENSTRVMTLKAEVRGRFASDALAEVQPLVSALTESPNWPSGYRVEFGGEQEESAEAQSNLAKAMPLSLSILAFILISQFNSLRRFAIIVLTIPPMMIGVVPGLLATGSSFGFMTLLGLIALLGIIVNNAILLIDETDAQLAEGLPLLEATVEAAKSRLRPILMTTITTIIGLLPLALGGGGMWSSMAYAMMFGLGFATLLTLLLCPVLFVLFFSRDYADRRDAA